MSQTIDAWPLAWPATWPRTDYPERSRFGVSFAVARDELLYELDLLGATDVVISSNVELRRDGLPYANRPEPIDTGVAIYFTIDSRQQCIPVDRWDRVKDNLRAAGLTIQALRGWSGGGRNTWSMRRSRGLRRCRLAEQQAMTGGPCSGCHRV